MNKKDLLTLAASVARLSNLLTREREAIPHSYLKDKGLREAYIRYYVPVNLQKIHVPLRELSLHPAGIFRNETEMSQQLTKGHEINPPIPPLEKGGQGGFERLFPRKGLRILDLGSGPGTAILGVMDFFSECANKPSLEFTAVDQIEENLRDAERLFRDFKEDSPVNATLLTIHSEIERTKSLPEGPFDIIILSNVLSEILLPDHEGNAKQVNLLISLIKRTLASNGSCIIIEPALRATSRKLLEVRDGLLREGLHIYSPCLINIPCPALTNPKDWCHEDIPWEPLPEIREIDKLIGLKKDSLKFSYLTIRKDSLSLSDIFGYGTFRVVSEPLISKGKIEYYLCGEGGRRLAVRLNKDESRLNETFSGLKRGNIVSIGGLIDEGKRFKVGKDTVVSLNTMPNFTTIP